MRGDGHPTSARAAGLLEGAILAGLFALPFLALFLTPRLYFPYVTARGFAFRAIVALTAACWAGLALIEPRFRPRRSAILWCFAAALAAMAAADALSDDPARSLFGNFVRMEGYWTLLHLFAIFVVASAVLSTERRWTRYFATSVAASVLVAAFGLAQRWGYLAAPWGTGRIDATFGNPAYLAAYLLMHAFLAGFLLVRAGGIFARAALACACALDLAVLWLTATRGAAVGLAAGIVVAALAIASSAGERASARRLAALAAALVILGSAGFVVIRHAPLVARSAMLERFAAIGPGDATVDLRFRIWRIAWQAIRDRPVLGWGQENFVLAVDRHFDPAIAHDSEWVDRAHNLVLDWLVAGGAVGGLAYLSLFAAAAWLLWRGPRAPGDALLGGLLAGYFVATLFLFDGTMSYLLFASVLAYLHARAVRERGHRRAAAVTPALLGLGAVSAALVLGGALWLDLRGLVAAAAMERALTAHAEPVSVSAGREGSVTLAAPARSNDALIEKRDWFRRAIDEGSFGTREARELLALSAYEILSAGDDPWVRENFAPAAIAAMTAQVREHPEARDWLFLGSLLVVMGRYDEAIAALDAAKALAPRRQSIHLVLAAAFRRKGEPAKALAADQDAFELDPTYDAARLDYAAAAIAAGDEERGRQLLVARYGTDMVPDDRVIAAYGAAKRDDKVIALWRLRVASEPDNANYRIQLSGALMRAGRGLDAVKELGGLNRILTRPQGAQ